MAKHPSGTRRTMTPEEEWPAAFGTSLLQALVPAYDDWRRANAGTCRKGDVGEALLYLTGILLAELAEGELPARWPVYVTAAQGVLREGPYGLADAMVYARQQVRRPREGD